MDQKDLKFIKQEFEGIVAYEKAWRNSPNNQTQSASIPVNKILSYFGAKNICALYGCSVVDDNIARILITKAFV